MRLGKGKCLIKMKTKGESAIPSHPSTVVIPEGSRGLTRETRDSILLSACTLKEVLFDKIGD